MMEIERNAQFKAKSQILDQLYSWFLEKRSDDWVIAEIARKDLPRMKKSEWSAMKQFFRQRETMAPEKMQRIRQKIGKC